MTTINDLCQYLEQVAPTTLAESWDNVGLLVGDRGLSVNKVMTCLTITPTTAHEAITSGVDLVITHHPLPFHSTKRITTDTKSGSMLWQLARAGVCIYSAHTAFDSADGGINQQWASQLKLADVAPLTPIVDPTGTLAAGQVGAGRCGIMPGGTTLEALATQVKTELNLETLRVVGKPSQTITKVAIACGSGGSFLPAVIDHGCDALLTGEATFHTCLEAEANEIALILPGHYASERFAMEKMADRTAAAFADLEVWASRDEADPLRSL